MNIKAKYTVVLKTMLDDPLIRPKIDKALSTYPLYQPPKKYDLVPDRAEVNERLLNHYKYREIGFETIGRFLDELEIAMRGIMPYYNERLKTVVTMAEIPNPFDNVDVVETFEEERTDRSTSDGTTTTSTETTAKDTTTTNTETVASDTTTTKNDVESNSKQVKSSTPQNEISIPAKSIDSVPYADEVNWGKDNSKSNGSSTSNGETSAESTTETDGETTAESTGTSKTENESNGTTKHTFTKKGNQGVNTYAHDMNEFRTSIIDVVEELINDPRIKQLFMLVY